MCPAGISATVVVTAPPSRIACSATVVSSASTMNPADPAVAQDVGDLLGGEHEVDRDQDHPGACRGERQHGVLPAVVRQQRDPVAGSEAVVVQVRPRHGPPDGRTRRRSARRRRRRSRSCPAGGGPTGAEYRRAYGCAPGRSSVVEVTIGLHARHGARAPRIARSCRTCRLRRVVSR